MKFSIVTPSLNMLPDLRRCHASIMDQDEAVEHIVKDAGSTDGTADWLNDTADLTGFVRRDRGMYDAINHGMEHASGDILSYLNCDEQYLPGTLTRVREFFSAHSSVDFVFGDSLLVQGDGSLLAFRKGYTVRWPYIAASHLYVLSCTMFFRRRVLDRGMRFDDRFRTAGDADFVLRALRAGFGAAHISRYFSAFTFSGANMSLGENAHAESRALRQQMPLWVRAFRLPINVARLTEKTLCGAYRERSPLAYEIYSGDALQARARFTATRLGWRWPPQPEYPRTTPNV